MLIQAWRNWRSRMLLFCAYSAACVLMGSVRQYVAVVMIVSATAWFFRTE